MSMTACTMTAITTMMLHACALHLAKMATRSSACADSVKEFLPLEGAVSGVWKFFGFPARNGKILEQDKRKRKWVHCKICHCVFSYVHNTTNLWQHLQEAHIDEYHGVKSPSAHRESGSAEKAAARQSTIGETLLASKPLPHTSQQWKSVTSSVCYFITKVMQPFQTVNDPGFRQLLHTLEPRYECPDRKTISTSYMPKLYSKEKERIGQQWQM